MRFLASDLDGTLLHENRIIDGNAEAIREFRENGNKFIIATGRDLRGVKAIENSEKLEFDYLVLCNGALVLDSEFNIISNKQINHSIAKDIIYSFKEEENICAYVGYEDKAVLLNPGETSDLGRVLEYFTHIDEVENIFNKEREYSIVSFFARDNCSKRAEGLVNKLKNKYGQDLEICRNQFSIDIMPKNCSKGNGINMVLEIENGKHENLYTIGDSYNDLSMFEITENSYTFNNVEDAVKAKAKNLVDYVHECIVEALSQG